MANFSDGKSLIPGLFEHVRKRLNTPLCCKLEVLLKGVVGCIMVSFRTEPGQQGVSGRTAGRSGHIMISEKPPGFGKRINSWRLNIVHPVTTKFRPQIIDGNK